MALIDSIKQQVLQGVVQEEKPKAAPAPTITLAKKQAAPPTREERIEAQRRMRAGLAPLAEPRVGCTVWWSAAEISVDPLVFRRALANVERQTACETCGAQPGKDCVAVEGIDEEWDGTSKTITTHVHEARCMPLVPLVRSPVGIVTAMRRAIARSQGALPDGLRWFDREDEDSGTLTIVLGSEVQGKDIVPGDALANARWSILVDVASGAVSTPSSEVLDQDERNALTALLLRYEKEREFLTAADINTILVKILLQHTHLNGIRAKLGGSVYFVPAPKDEMIDRLADAFELAGVSLRRTEIVPGSAAQLGEEATASLEEDALKILTDAREAVARMNAALAGEKGKGKPKFESTLKRLDEVDALRKRAKAYSKMLGAITTNVEIALKEAEDASSSVLSALSGGIV